METKEAFFRNDGLVLLIHIYHDFLKEHFVHKKLIVRVIGLHRIISGGKIFCSQDLSRLWFVLTPPKGLRRVDSITDRVRLGIGL